MSIRKFTVNLYDNNSLLETMPAILLTAGVEGEHKATRLKFLFHMPSAFLEAEHVYVIEYDDGNGTGDVTDELELESSVIGGKTSYFINWDVPYEATKLGTVNISLKIFDIGNGEPALIVKSLPVKAVFKPERKITGTVRETLKNALETLYARVSALIGRIESGEFKGDKGDKGDKGEKGDKGDRGESVSPTEWSAGICDEFRERYAGEWFVGGFSTFNSPDITQEDIDEFYETLGIRRGSFFIMPWDASDALTYIVSGPRRLSMDIEFNFFVPQRLITGYAEWVTGEGLVFTTYTIGEEYLDVMDSFANKDVLDQLSIGDQSRELELDGEPVNKPTAWSDITGKLIAEFDEAVTIGGEPFRLENYVGTTPDEPSEDSFTPAENAAFTAWIATHDYIAFTTDKVAYRDATNEIYSVDSRRFFFDYSPAVWCIEIQNFGVNTEYDSEGCPWFVDGENVRITARDDLIDELYEDYSGSGSLANYIDWVLPTRSWVWQGLDGKQTKSITDAGGYFTNPTVEDALAQLGAAQKKAVSQSAPTAITLADNTEYRLTNVANLTLTYPQGDFEVWVRLTTAASGTVTITLPTSQYIGEAPTFGNGETWEVSIKDGVVIAQKVVS